MSFKQEESEFLTEYKKTQERLDNLYWKKHSNWYLKFKKFPDEEFKKIDKYLGFYFISNYGQVVSFQNKTPLLRRYSFINGYFGVNLSLFAASKFHFIHELVFSHFVGELKPNRQVIHINGIVTDNRHKNLRLSRASDALKKGKKKFDFSLYEQIESQRPERQSASTSVLQFDTEGKFIREFPSIKKASYTTGIDRNLIHASLKGTAKAAGGYQWRYKKDLLFASGIQDIEPVKQGSHTRARPVLQFDLQGKFIREYPSIMEAGRITGKNPASISECARGKLVTSGGSQWRYKDDSLFKDGVFEIPPVRQRKSHNSKAILQFDLDGNYIREFPSISHASRAVGFGSGGFNRCLSGECLTAAGYQWRLKQNPLFKDGIVKLPPVINRDVHKAKPVLQYSLRGKFLREFKSLNEATRISGVSKGSIMRCLKGEVQVGGEFQWRFKNELTAGKDTQNIGAVEKAPRSRRQRGICQFGIDGTFIKEYGSIVEAARDNGILGSGIRACALGNYKKAGGFQWRFRDDPAFADGITDIDPLPLTSGRKGRPRGAGKRAKRVAYDYNIPVLKFDRTGKFLCEYSSLKAAEEACCVIRSHIFQCIKGERKSAGGCQWRFKNESIFENGICGIGPVKRATNSVPVLCFDLKGNFVAEYPSISDAAKVAQVNDGVISNCLKGGCKTAGGFQWKRKSDPSFKKGIIDIPPVDKITGWMRKEILQFDLGGKFVQRYPSVMAAARDLDIGMSAIRHVIYGGGLSAAGYQWRSINDPLFESGIVDIEPLGERYPKAKALLQYNTKGNLKEEFRTIRDAVNKTGVSRHLILKCAKGERESAGGYIWKFKNQGQRDN